jgi:hypothetical protein
MKKYLILSIILIIGVILFVGTVSASSGNNTTIKKPLNVSANKKVPVAFSTSILIDHGGYSWTDIRGHRCYYTWQSSRAFIRYVGSKPVYNDNKVYVRMTYSHNGNIQEGWYVITNMRNHILYTYIFGNMFIKDHKNYVRYNYSASYYTSHTLAKQYRMGLIKPLLDYQTGPDFKITFPPGQKIEYYPYDIWGSKSFPHINNFTVTVTNIAGMAWNGYVDVNIYLSKNNEYPIQTGILIETIRLGKSWTTGRSITGKVNELDLTGTYFKPYGDLDEGNYYIMMVVKPIYLDPYEEPAFKNNVKTVGPSLLKYYYDPPIII